MIDHFKKYEYQELNYEAKHNRTCYTVGKVYRYETRKGFKQRHLDDGDLLLCIMKSGDCHYDFIRIVKTTETSYSGIPTYQLHAYFKTEEKVSCYGGMEDAFPKMEALTPTDMVHVLYDEQVLIPLYATLSEEKLSDLLETFELESKLQEKRMKSLTQS